MNLRIFSSFLFIVLVAGDEPKSFRSVWLKNKITGLCLSAGDNSAVIGVVECRNNKPIQTWSMPIHYNDREPADSEWITRTLYHDSYKRCLEDRYGSAPVNAIDVIKLYNCDDFGMHTRWLIHLAAARTIQNQGSGRCLTSNDKTHFASAQCTPNNWAQEWIVAEQNAIGSVASTGFHTMESIYNLCMAVTPSSKADKANVIFATCDHDQENFMWRIESDTVGADGVWDKIVIGSSGMCLTVADFAVENYGVLVQRPCAKGDWNQYWKRTEAFDKIVDAEKQVHQVYTLTGKLSGRCLTAHNGGRPYIYDCKGKDDRSSQLFHFHPLPAAK